MTRPSNKIQANSFFVFIFFVFKIVGFRRLSVEYHEVYISSTSRFGWSINVFFSNKQ